MNLWYYISTMLCFCSQARRWLVAGALFALMALATVPSASAHVGDAGPVQTIVMDAGPYELAITMTIPPALPGPLLVDIAPDDEPFPETFEVRLTRYGSPFPEKPAALLTLGSAISVTTRLDIDAPGDWEVEIVARGASGEGVMRLPVTVFQPPLPPTTVPLAVALGVLVVSLLAGAAVGAGGRHTRPGFASALRLLNYAAFAAATASAVLAWLQFTPLQAETTPAVPIYSGGAPHINLLLATEPQTPDVNAPLVMTLDLRDGATGLPADDLSPHHDALLHLAVVDDSGGFFAHMHPARVAPGVYAVTLIPDRPGTYTAYAELMRHGGSLQVVTGRFAVGGQVQIDTAPPPAPGLGVRSIGDLTVEVRAQPTPLRSGQLTTLSVIVSDADGPVRDLEPWLGMGGHLMMRHISEALFSHIHAAAPMAAPGSTLRYGPELRFVHNFPRSGIYQAWFQFRRAGQVMTVPVTLEVQSAQ
ncbi:hypothetical protein [Roseiflexus castenholzii]|uniref:hypothetical protein n=1 Tax=Roseiflexus castenholzii TaxID=120962 RepID=UPI003C79A359